VGVRVTDSTNVALYDSTSEVAFGPIFASSEEAEDFLEWLRSNSDRKRFFDYNRDRLMFMEDPREYLSDELTHLSQLWKDSRENGT
jgi:hypothetical protein